MGLILYFAGIIICIISICLSVSVHRKFEKWSKEPNARGITGADAARLILRNAGIVDVSVVRCDKGRLSDHYNPKTKTLALSPDVYDKATIASLAVAAHECGHAVQDAEAYVPHAFRTMFAPIASFGSTAGIWMCMIGILITSIFYLPMLWLIDIGIAFFSLAVLFHLITLPVEFNASKRALETLENNGYLQSYEMNGAKSVLSAAALTYVAAAAAAVIQLLRLLLIRGRD